MHMCIDISLIDTKFIELHDFVYFSALPIILTIYKQKLSPFKKIIIIKLNISMIFPVSLLESYTNLLNLMTDNDIKSGLLYAYKLYSLKI